MAPAPETDAADAAAPRATPPTPRRPLRRRAGLPLLALATGVSFLAGYQLSQRSAASKNAAWSDASSTRLAQAVGSRPTSASGHTASLERPEDAAAAAQTFETVYDLVREHYVDALPPDAVMSRATVRAMLARLGDPNCVYLEPEQRALVDAEAQGNYAGIGATLYVRSVPRPGLTYREPKITVVAPIPGSPAERAGLKAGDVITHLNGRWIRSGDPLLGYNRLVRQGETPPTPDEPTDTVTTARPALGLLAAQLILRGDTQTSKQQNVSADRVTLTLERPNTARPMTLTVSLSNAAAATPPVSVRSLSHGTVYLRIPAFTDRTVKEVKDALAAQKPSTGLLLDLRGNAGGIGGGAVPSALDTAKALDALLSSGGAFGIERLGSGHETILKTPHHSGHLVPLVVLVDKGTAAAAEALAAALSDKGVATLAGQRTSGIPYVQSLVRLPDGSAFTLTTGRLISPKRTDWAANGLSPAISLPLTASEPELLARAARLFKHRQFARAPKTE